MLDKAKAICDAMGGSAEEVFAVTRDTTPLSAKTVLEYHRLISTIMSQAEKEMLIPYNPAARATPPKAVRNDPNYYQPEEVDKILEKLDTASVKWRAITYKNGKTRTLRIAQETVALLEEHRKLQDELRAATGDRWVDSGFVFTRENGDRMHPDSITDWLNKFSIADDIPHIHPHAFRHTAASTMIANGVDVITTAGELGHNPETTATYYAHIINEAKAKAESLRATVFQRRKGNKGASEEE